MRSRAPLSIREPSRQPADIHGKDEARYVDIDLGDDDKNPSKSRLLVGQRNLSVLLCTGLLLLNIVQWRGSSHYQTGFSSLRNPAIASATGANLSDKSCEISLGHYRGPVYHSPESGTIGEPKCLLDSKWIQVNLHTVKFPGSDTVYDDWMWIDYHDRINVVVEDETTVGMERRFLVFEQSKYALEGRSSFAIIGGIIEPSEDPETAARREVNEEMDGLVCKNFHFLGRYRTDVNRGMGWLNSFLATKCSRDSKPKIEHSISDEIGAADTEKQQLKSITLTQLREAARNGEFLEVQWTATVAQALLHPELGSST